MLVVCPRFPLKLVVVTNVIWCISSFLVVPIIVLSHSLGAAVDMVGYKFSIDNEISHSSCHLVQYDMSYYSSNGTWCSDGSISHGQAFLLNCSMI